MKRSKTLFAANILATGYAIYLLWTYGGAVVKAGGMEFVEALGAYFKVMLELLGANSSLMFLYVVVILLCVHIVLFTLGSLIGWLAFVGKKSAAAKFAATLYLVATVAFPIYLLIGLPITIVGYVGGSKQKKINATSTADTK